MKKAIALVLALVFLACSAQGIRAAAASGVPEDSARVQDLYDFARTDISIGKADINKAGNWHRKFKGDRAAVEQVIGRYVEALTSGGWNFETVHIHEYEYKRYKAWSVTLRYTGTAGFPRDTISQQFDDKYAGDLMIYYSGEYSTFEGHIYAAAGLEMTDLGLRSDGTVEDVGAPGASSGAELAENPDGSFSTSDGRLTAAPGEACVLRDGVMYRTDEVSIERNREKGQENIRIENYYRNEGIAMRFPYRLLMTGDSFGMKQMGQDVFADGELTSSLNGFFGTNFTYLFGICREGSYIWAHTDPTGALRELLVRVMLWDTDRQLGVFYIACGFATAPFEIEALAVVRLDGAVSYGGNAERLTMYVGDSRTFTFDRRAFMPSYELYAWEILEGSSCVELQGNRSAACKVTATWQGQARIRVTYTYGDTEPDVLTGKDRSVEKNITQEYVIDIIRPE